MNIGTKDDQSHPSSTYPYRHKHTHPHTYLFCLTSLINTRPSTPLSSKCFLTLDFPPKNLVFTSLFPESYTCPAHLNLLDLVSWIIIGEDYKSWSSSLCSFLQCSITNYAVPPLCTKHTKHSRTSHNVALQRINNAEASACVPVSTNPSSGHLSSSPAGRDGRRIRGVQMFVQSRGCLSASYQFSVNEHNYRIQLAPLCNTSLKSPKCFEKQRSWSQEFAG
jgi:hypothetical protein